MRTFVNGLVTGLVLQLAVGPVFFFIANLTLKGNVFNGFAGVAAVTLVDYFYIVLAIFGIGKLLENHKVKKVFGVVSSIILAIFGIIIIKGALNADALSTASAASVSLLTSFISVFVLTISSPMTIVFFTSLFTAKALEYGYKKNELWVFGLGTGFATFLFMGSSTVVFSLIKGSVPALLIQILNLIVGCLLIVYGGTRLIKSSRL